MARSLLQICLITLQTTSALRFWLKMVCQAYRSGIVKGRVS